jgi:murein L,D-transpeptidase YcbB/YkuD
MADPAVAAVRIKLADASLRKGAVAADLAALAAFYAERGGPPVWITGMGFSAKAQAVINEIGKADDWGLAAAAFELPPAGDLLATADAQPIAEIKLQLAVLKYARFARGGRVDPSSLSELIDQSPSLLNPKVVLTEIAASPAPDAHLQSLHPKHEQFQRLREALLKARGIGDDGAAKRPRNEQEIQRLLINMERWRWMPTQWTVPPTIVRTQKRSQSCWPTASMKKSRWIIRSQCIRPISRRSLMTRERSPVSPMSTASTARSPQSCSAKQSPMPHLQTMLVRGTRRKRSQMPRQL